MAAIDVAGFVADLKDHAVTHGFHVHDERHFVETYSLRQAWEVDLHPEDGCGGPVDLHIELDVDPRTLLAFEDAVLGLPDDVDPPDEFHFPLVLTWSLPPMPHSPDLLRLAIDLAPIGGLEMPLEVTAKRAQLDILIENTGRVNFTTVLRGERKGITKQVTLAGRPIHGWDIYSLPMNDPSKLAYTRTACAGACFYRATFKIEHPADAFLDTTQFTKGQVWLNGINLGRVWNIGPQNRLYVPGPWLRKGSNEIIVFDLAHSAQ